MSGVEMENMVIFVAGRIKAIQNKPVDKFVKNVKICLYRDCLCFILVIFIKSL